MLATFQFPTYSASANGRQADQWSIKFKMFAFEDKSTQFPARRQVRPAIAAMRILIGTVLAASGVAHAAGDAPTPRPLPDVLGVNHINSYYHLTDEDYINEGADQVLALGSRVIKLIIRDKLDGYYKFNSAWPEITNLVQAAELPYFKEVFAKPFSTFVLMTFAPGREIHYFTQGMTPEDEAHERQSYYEFTKYLLTTYRGTGKTFVFQNWEGDWVLTHPPLDLEKKPDPVAVEGMIKWLNARQDGVDQARAEVGTDGVQVYHAAEVNLVEKAQLGHPTVTNDVLPHTHCDLYSYSAYDTMGQNEAKFRAALTYLKEKAPDSKTFGENNVYIGEFGWPESLVGEEKRVEMVRYTVDAALDAGAPYILFWELYCDGPKPDAAAPYGNDEMVGNWLIRPDGSKSKAWDFFEKLLNDGSAK